MTGKSWQQMKRTCKTKNCTNLRPKGQDYCGPCWRFMKLAAEGEPIEAKRRAREEERASEDAERMRRLGA